MIKLIKNNDMSNLLFFKKEYILYIFTIVKIYLSLFEKMIYCLYKKVLEEKKMRSWSWQILP